MSESPKLCTTSGEPVEVVRAKQTAAEGMYASYIILAPEERAKGFVRPFRDAYRHARCGSTTRMGLAIAESYARDPSFYKGTFCVMCNAHFPVNQFVWTADGERVGS